MDILPSYVGINYSKLGTDFEYFLFSPLLGEMIQNWLIFFQMGLNLTPPTRHYKDPVIKQPGFFIGK